MQDPMHDDESTKDLVRELVAEGKHLLHEQARLMRLEVQTIAEEGRARLEQDLAIAKVEIKQEGLSAARAGGVIGLGGILAHAALYLVLFAIVFGLAAVMPLWLASLIVAAVVAAGALLFIKGGVDRFKRVRFPRRTVQHLQEDRQWMKDKSRALRSTIRANA